jgi:hypothetical protein
VDIAKRLGIVAGRIAEAPDTGEETDTREADSGIPVDNPVAGHIHFPEEVDILVGKGRILMEMVGSPMAPVRK